MAWGMSKRYVVVPGRSPGPFPADPADITAVSSLGTVMAAR